MSVNERVAIVTGSGSGIGEATVKLLASNGAKVVVNDLDQEKIDRVVSEIKANNENVIGIKADVTNPEDVKRLIDTTVEEFGNLDILVNNAGINWIKPFQEYSLEEFTKLMDINLKSVFLTCQAAAPYMMEQEYGRIINISSRAWLGLENQSVYSAAKAGVLGWTRTLALELAKHQITSNAICPGPVNTPLFKSLPEKEIQILSSTQPVRFIGDPEDLANGVLFFASDESSYITGQVFYIDGGKSLYQSLSV